MGFTRSQRHVNLVDWVTTDQRGNFREILLNSFIYVRFKFCEMTMNTFRVPTLEGCGNLAILEIELNVHLHGLALWFMPYPSGSTVTTKEQMDWNVLTNDECIFQVLQQGDIMQVLYIYHFKRCVWSFKNNVFGFVEEDDSNHEFQLRPSEPPTEALNRL